MFLGVCKLGIIFIKAKPAHDTSVLFKLDPKIRILYEETRIFWTDEPEIITIAGDKFLV